MTENIDKYLRAAVNSLDVVIFEKKLLETTASEISKETWEYIFAQIIYNKSGKMLETLIECTKINFYDDYYVDLFFQTYDEVNDRNIINILIANGLDVNKIINGDYLICIQCNRGNNETVKLLIENGANANVLIDANKIRLIADDDEDIFQLLINCGLDVNEDNGTFLMHACEYDAIKIAKLLLVNGINLELYGGEALICALRNKSTIVAELLINYQVNVNYKNCLALEIAISYRQESIIILLLKNGASMDMLNSNGDTKKNNKIIDFLYENGADPVRIMNLLWD